MHPSLVRFPLPSPLFGFGRLFWGDWVDVVMFLEVWMGLDDIILENACPLFCLICFIDV